MSLSNGKKRKEVEGIVKESGHKLHLRVVSMLEIEGWDVDVSPYYIDELSDKPREVDIIAKKPFYYKSKADGEQKTFYLLLSIECKYLTQNVVVWGRENKLQASSILTNMDSRMSYLIETQDAWCRYSKFFNVGRLISEGNNSQVFQSGILQAVKAALDIYNRSMSGPTIFFPAIVYELDEGVEIYAIGDGVSNSDKPKPLDGRSWIYHIDYAYTRNNKPQQKQFYIDLINEKKFVDFIQKLETEGREIAKVLEFYSAV